MSIRIDVDRDVIIVISFDDSKQIGDVEDRRLRSRLASSLTVTGISHLRAAVYCLLRGLFTVTVQAFDCSRPH
jgi:hypothetical protein